MTEYLRKPAMGACRVALCSTSLRLLASTAVIAIAAIAPAGTLSAQEAKPATAEAGAPAPSQATPPAPASSASAPVGNTEVAAPTADVAINPVDVTAAKPKKKPKKAASAPATTPVPAPPAPPSSGTAAAGPIKEQDKTQLGRLTAATPINGTVIDRKALETSRVQDTQRELLRQYPGVSLIRNIRIPNGGKGYTNNLVDGLATRSATLGNFGFLDEINMFDVESIELTRGPGSVLYSSKAVGGAINVITRDPPKVQERSVFADLGMNGFHRLGAFLAGSTANGGLGYSFNAAHSEDDAWRDRNAQDKSSGSAKFVLRPDEATKITLRGEYLDYYVEHAGVLTKAQFDTNWRQAQFTNLYEDKQFATGSIDLKRRLGEGGELQLAYTIHSNTGIDACPSGCSSNAASTTSIDIDYLTNNLRGVYRQDFDLLKSRVYLGMDAFLSDKKDDSWNRITNTDTRTTKKSAYTIDETTLAPFAQYEFSPLDGWRFTLGARYEDYSLEVDDRSPATNRDGEKHYSDLVRKAGVTYEFARDHRFWGGIAEGFYVPDTGSTVTGDNAKELEPETSLTYSAGIRGDFTKFLSYDVGYYHTDIENYSQNVSCPNKATCPDSTNADINSGRATYALAGEAKFRGIETTVSASPWQFLRFDASHTYAINSFVDFKDKNGDYSGNRLPASPEHHLNARATIHPLPGLQVQFQADYYSSYYLNARNNDSYERPIIYTLRASYQASENVELWAHGLNLFDTKYADRISASNVASPVRSYNEGYTPLTVRTGVSLKW